MKRNIADKLTILVCSCDTYEDLWYPFFKLLDTYWQDNPCRIILNTETKAFHYETLNIDTLGVCRKEENVSYGKRMRENIKAINTPYTLLLLDDFFVRRNVDVIQLENIIEMMEQHTEVAAVYLNKEGLGDMLPYVCPEYEQFKRYAMYKLNMQAAIWDTSKLLSYWEDIDNPWKWEIFANYVTFDKNDIFLCLKNNLNQPIFYGYDAEGMGVFRGKWVVSDVGPLFEKHGIKIDFQKRGVYCKEKEKNYFSNKKEVARYMLQRMKKRYILGMIYYYLNRSILRKLGKAPRFQSYPEKLQSKYEKKRG